MAGFTLDLNKLSNIPAIGAGPLAQRPAAGNVNAVWFKPADDTRAALYIDDGAAWQPMFVPPTLPTLAQILENDQSAGDFNIDAVSRLTAQSVNSIGDITSGTGDTPGGYIIHNGGNSETITRLSSDAAEQLDLLLPSEGTRILANDATVFVPENYEALRPRTYILETIETDQVFQFPPAQSFQGQYLTLWNDANYDAGGHWFLSMVNPVIDAGGNVAGSDPLPVGAYQCKSVADGLGGWYWLVLSYSVGGFF